MTNDISAKNFKKVFSVALTAILVVSGFFVFSGTALATTTITVTSNTSWSALNPQPTNADTVTVKNGATLTVDVTNGTAKIIELGDRSTSGTLLFNAGTKVTVTTALNIDNNGKGSIDMSAGGTLSIGGTISVTDLGTWTPGTGTVEYNKSGNQTITAALGSYNNLITSGSGTKTLGGAITVNGNLTIGSSTTLDVSSGGNYGLVVKGDWSNSGTFTQRSGTVTLSGTSAQTMTGATTFYNLTLNNSNGLNINNNETINHILTLTSGNITTGNNKVIISAGGTVTHTSGHVVGNLQMNIPTGTPVITYHVGTTSAYTPLLIDVDEYGSGGAIAGGLIASTIGSGCDNFSGSGLSPAKSINRCWTLVPAGAALGTRTYKLTLTFLTDDVPDGANTSNFVVRRFSNGTWNSTTAGTRTGVSTQATGINSFSDFAVGQPDQPPTMTVTSPNGGEKWKGTQAIIWTADDPDGDTLTITTQKSTDGVIWTDIATGEANDGSFSWDTTATADGNNYKIRVIASDGQLTGQDDSNSVFTIDNTPPTIIAPDDIIQEATGPATSVLLGSPVVSDNLDANPIVTNNDLEAYPVGATAVTWTATDHAGNSATATQNITIVDITAPNIIAPADITQEANGVESTIKGELGLGTPTVSDVADPEPSVTNDAPELFLLGTTTVTWTATDASENSATATQTVTIIDTTPPSITPPEEQTFEATGLLTEPEELTPATAEDIADPDPVITYEPHSFPVGTTEVTWTATDASENSSETTSKVTIEDTTGPVIDGHEDLTIEATGPDGALVTYTNPTANDLVDGEVAVTCELVSGSQFPLDDTEVTCTAQDSQGNEAEPVTFTVSVVDTTGPVIAEHGDETAEATFPSGAVVEYTNPTANDLVDGEVAVTCEPASGSQFALGDTEVTCTAEDNQSNISTSNFTVYVVDTTAPEITAPDDVTVEAEGVTTQVELGDPVVEDIVDSNPAITSDAPETFPLGTTVVTWTATDASNNTASATQEVIIQDTTPPDITAPDDQTFEATGLLTEPEELTPATAEDIADPDPVITYEPHSFPVGTTEVTWTATDVSENIATATSNVIIQDTTPPEITDSLSDITLGAISPEGIVVVYTIPSATDLVDESVPVNCSPASESTFPLGTTPVTCTATDSHGNSSSKGFNIIIKDNDAPVLSIPSDFTEEATGPSGATITYSASAVDAIDDTVSVNCSISSGLIFPIGDTTVNCSATDTAGNVAEGSFTITVQDATPPTLIVPLDITQEAVSSSGATVTFTASASDTVSGPLTPTCTPMSDSTFPLGTTTVTCTATDAAGNTATSSFNIIVQDTTKPIITLNGDQYLTIEMGSTYTEAGATWTDIVDGSGAANIGGDTINTAVVGVYHVTYNKTDIHSNIALEVVRTVTVQDTTAPVITRLGDATVNLTVGNPYTDAGATAFDDVDGDITDNIAVTGLPIDTSAPGTFTIYYNVSDAALNPAIEVTRTVNVNSTPPASDTTAPVITLIGSATVNLTVGDSYNDAGATASDNVDGDISANIVAVNPVDTNVVGTYTITYNVSDAALNPAIEVTRTVNVSAAPDTTVPTVSAGPNIAASADITISDSSATDASGIKSYLWEKVSGPGEVTFSDNTILNPSVSATIAGEYKLKLTVTDNANNSASDEMIYTKLSESQVMASSSTNVTEEQKEVVINNSNNSETTINIPSSVSDATINVNSLISDDGTSATALLPQISINANTSISSDPVIVNIPADTTVTAPTGWNGTINSPTVKDNSSVSVPVGSDQTASVSSVIEIGYGDVKLVFDKAVRILLPGQAGKNVGYSRSGVFTFIDSVCSENSQSAGDALLPEGDCKIDVGSDLVVWTKHFTKFATYTISQNPVPVISGGGLILGLTIPPESVRISNIGENSVTITWTTSYFSTSQVIYDTVPGRFDLNAGSPKYGYAYSKEGDDSGLEKVTGHSVTIYGLSSGTTYYYRTVSQGSLAVSSQEYSFTTQGVTKAGEEVVTPQPGAGGIPSGEEIIEIPPAEAPAEAPAEGAIEKPEGFIPEGAAPAEGGIVTIPPEERVPGERLGPLLLASAGVIRETAWMVILATFCLIGLIVIGIREWELARKKKKSRL